jgi:hypothetical protein
LVEYSDLKTEEILLALLRPEGEGSTFMAGHEHKMDGYISKFQFENSALETLDDVVEWAEDQIDELEMFLTE